MSQPTRGADSSDAPGAGPPAQPAPRAAGALLPVFLALGIAMLAGWLLVLGRTVILPFLSAVIVVYVLTTAVAAMRRWPPVRRAPAWILHLGVLSLFAAALVGLGAVVAVTLEQLADRAAEYQANFEALAGGLADRAGFAAQPEWAEIRDATFGRMDLPAMAGRALNSLAAFGGALFLMVIYAGFLLGEWAQLPDKIARAFRAEGQARRIMAIGAEINRKIGDYLAVKTAINVVLGALSLAVLWLFGVDFAVFWAVVIGLLNYIPYVGSAVGVMLPVLLSVAQFGDVWTTLALGGALMAMQVFVGNYLEPRWIGRQLNLSPVAVILALAVWSALWGVPGAILAVPLTSVVVIVFASFPGTRPVAVLVSDLRADDPP